MKLIYALAGMLMGIYLYSGYYLAMLISIPILWKWRKSFIVLIPTVLAGIVIAYARTSYVDSGVVSYVNNNCVFLENKGLYKCENNELKIGDKIQFTHYHSKITSIQRKTTGSLLLPKFIINHRQAIVHTLRSSQHYGFWLAILLGDRSMLDQSTTEAFLLSGVYHFLCISGLQFGLLYQITYIAFYALFQRSKKINYLCTIYATYDILPKIFAIGFCLYYFAISLFSTSSLRAIILLIMSFTGYSSRTLLTVSMIGMLAYNPFYAYDIGFIMSFLGSYMLVSRAKYYDITIALMPLTSMITPLSVVSNLLGTAPITVLTLWGVFASLIRSTSLLNSASPIITLLQTTLSRLSYGIHMARNQYTLPAFGAFLYMYILFNARIFIYIGCIVVLMFQILM